MNDISAGSENTSDPEQPGAAVEGLDTNGIAGFMFSMFGLFGWVGTFLSLFLLEFSKSGDEDMWGALLVYLKQVTVGVFGFLACAFFSATGSIISLVGLGRKRSQIAVPGLVVGLIGILSGFCLVMWRVHVWTS